MPKYMLGDGHQGISLGYSSDDIIHLIFGAHGTKPFYYRISWPDLVVVDSEVDKLALTSNLITYPQFYEYYDHLILLYRDDTLNTYNINKYDSKKGVWQQWFVPLLTTPSDVDSVYLNNLGIRWKTMALAYTLRFSDLENPDHPRVLNEDIRVIYSIDGCVTWRSFNGLELSLPVSASEPSVSLSVPLCYNLSNQSGAWLSSDKIYWVAYFANDSNGIPQIFVSEFSLLTQQVSTSQVTHRTTGFSLIGKGSLSLPLSRPAILGMLDRIVVIYRENNDIKIAWRSPKGESGWRHMTLYSGFVKNWEPIIDFTQLSRKNICIYIQGAEQGSNDTNFSCEVTYPAILLDLPKEAILATMPTLIEEIRKRK
jgi:hypothetical protein